MFPRDKTSKKSLEEKWDQTKGDSLSKAISLFHTYGYPVNVSYLQNKTGLEGLQLLLELITKEGKIPPHGRRAMIISFLNSKVEEERLSLCPALECK